MVDPINYQSMLTQLDTSPLLGAQQVQLQKREVAANQGVRLQQIEAAKAKVAAEQAQQAAYQSDVQGYLGDPSSANLTALIAKHPGQYQALKELADQQSAAIKKRNLEAAMTLGGYVSAGQSDKALDFARRRREALANAGESTEVTDSLIASLEKGDLNAARGVAGLVIAASADKEQTAPILEALGWDGASRRAAVDDARADEMLDLRRQEVSSRQADRAADNARADRKAAGSGKGGNVSSAAYEYRIGPDGKLQRRKR